jgi:hypothetical protein
MPRCGRRVERRALDGSEADAGADDDALLIELAQLVDGWRGAFFGKCQPAAQPALFDSDIAPQADRLVGIVVPERDRMRLEVLQVPAVASTTSP